MDKILLLFWLIGALFTSGYTEALMSHKLTGGQYILGLCGLFALLLLVWPFVLGRSMALNALQVAIRIKNNDLER